MKYTSKRDLSTVEKIASVVANFDYDKDATSFAEITSQLKAEYKIALYAVEEQINGEWTGRWTYTIYDCNDETPEIVWRGGKEWYDIRSATKAGLNKVLYMISNCPTRYSYSPLTQEHIDKYLQDFKVYHKALPIHLYYLG